MAGRRCVPTNASHNAASDRYHTSTPCTAGIAGSSRPRPVARRSQAELHGPVATPLGNDAAVGRWLQSRRSVCPRQRWTVALTQRRFDCSVGHRLSVGSSVVGGRGRGHPGRVIWRGSWSRRMAVDRLTQARLCSMSPGANIESGLVVSAQWFGGWRCGSTAMLARVSGGSPRPTDST
jgi:hypothetical protein